MPAGGVAYPGGELELFAEAGNWKRYWSQHIEPYLGRMVLEVGAGIGSNSIILFRHACDWVCLEPDPHLAKRLSERLANERVGARVVVGTIDDLPAEAAFDCVLYLDVLEHIAADRDELAKATGRLVAGGHLVVLAPACQWLFSPFDAAIGHHRRYGRSSLRRLTPPELELVACKNLDSAGLVASAANRFLVRSRMPTRAQVRIWDSLIVPVSRVLDRAFGYRLGKSILIAWRKR